MNANHSNFVPDDAQGVFTTIRVIGGNTVSLSAHLVRLSKSVGPLPSDLHSQIADVADSLSDAQAIRVVVADGNATIEIVDRPLPRPMALTTFVFENWRGNHKTVSRPDFERGTALIIDTNGNVLEADNANVFAVRGNTLVTAPTDNVLPGISRALVIDVALSLGLKVVTRLTSLDELQTADFVFASNAPRGIMRVASVNNVSCGHLATVYEQILAAANLRKWEISAERYQSIG